MLSDDEELDDVWLVAVVTSDCVEDDEDELSERLLDDDDEPVDRLLLLEELLLLELELELLDRQLLEELMSSSSASRTWTRSSWFAPLALSKDKPQTGFDPAHSFTVWVPGTNSSILPRAMAAADSR